MRAQRGAPARAMAICMALSVIGSIAFLILFVSSPSIDAQSSSLSVRIAAWKSADGVVELCVDLRDATVGEVRQCPRRRQLTFARATEQRWLRSRSIEIAPEVSLWVRARRVGQRLDLGLGVSIEGEARGVRARSWVLDWPTAEVDRWLRTSSIALRLPVAPHPELWTSEAGVAAGAQRLEVGRRAPEFRLPRLGDFEDSLVSLTAAMSNGTGRSRDERVTVIVFWASWAPRGDATLTMLDQLMTSRDDLLMIAVNVYEEAEGAGATFAQRYGPTLLHLVDETASVAQHFRVDGLPELFLIDAQGVYRAVIRGAAPLAEILAMIDAID